MINWMVWYKTVYIYIKMDLVLNSLQWLMYHKNQPNQTKHLVAYKDNRRSKREKLKYFKHENLCSFYKNTPVNFGTVASLLDAV